MTSSEDNKYQHINFDPSIPENKKEEPTWKEKGEMPPTGGALAGIGKVLDPVGSALETGLKPVALTVDGVLKPVTDSVGSLIKPLADPSKAGTYGKRPPKEESIGGKLQTGNNPLGL